MSFSAILWDYDGTLADSTQKNIEVTLEILRRFIPDVDENIPEVLASCASYQDANGKAADWKELYRVHYGLNDEEILEAGKMWTPTQLANKTFSDIFEGAEAVLKAFEHLPMGICSQNGGDLIKASLEHHGLLKYFKAVVGFDDLPFAEQKPHPAVFLSCLDALGFEDKNKHFVYIGDHSVDVIFGRNAERELQKNFSEAKVTVIAIHHPGFYADDDESFPPDYTVKSFGELLELLRKLQTE